MDTSEVSLLAR